MNKTIELIKVFNIRKPIDALANKVIFCTLDHLKIRPCEMVYWIKSPCYNCIFNQNRHTKVNSRINELVKDYESKID